MKELWKIMKEEAIWSIKMYFEPFVMVVRFVKKQWKDES